MMPVDVGSEVSILSLSFHFLNAILQIYGYLHPFDLLCMARFAKVLREFLMRHSSRCIWKKTLAGVDDLPECPSDMSEPEYVHLMFDPHCNVRYSSCTLSSRLTQSAVLSDPAQPNYYLAHT
jgi:hypothetical protein